MMAQKKNSKDYQQYITYSLFFVQTQAQGRYAMPKRERFPTRKMQSLSLGAVVLLTHKKKKKPEKQE